MNSNRDPWQVYYRPERLATLLAPQQWVIGAYRLSPKNPLVLVVLSEIKRTYKPDGYTERQYPVAILDTFPDSKTARQTLGPIIIHERHCFEDFSPRLGQYRFGNGFVCMGFDYELEEVEEMYPGVFERIVDLPVCKTCFAKHLVYCEH